MWKTAFVGQFWLLFYSGTFRKFKEKVLSQNPSAVENKVCLSYFWIFFFTIM